MQGAGIAGYGQSAYGSGYKRTGLCGGCTDDHSISRGKYRQRKSETALSSVPVSRRKRRDACDQDPADADHKKQTIQVENPLLAISRGKLSEEEDYQMILNPDIVGGKKDGCKSSNARTV